MFIEDLFEAKSPRIIVTYPGRFQPFHQGHYAVFQILQKTFGPQNVYILTSDKSDNKKSPFNFGDKLILMTAAGVPKDKIIETSNMYSLPEEFNAANTIFIAALGAPDADRLRPDTLTSKDSTDKLGNFKPAGSPSYYKNWTGRTPVVTADKHGYVFVVPEIHKTIELNGVKYDVSHGTECRELWNKIRNDQKLRHEFLIQLYNKATNNIEAIFDKIPYTQSKTEDLSPMGQSTISPISGNVKEEAEGVGVIAKKNQRNNSKYKTSLTKDVKPGAIQHALRGFRLAENSVINEKWTKKYKKSINCSNPKGFSQRAHCAGRKARQAGKPTKSNSVNESIQATEFVNMLGNFLEIAIDQLQLKSLPKFKLVKHVQTQDGQATFGRYLNNQNIIQLGIMGRHPVDILRTLAHELAHYKQDLKKQLNDKSGETGSPEENEAHVQSGIIMRRFNKKYPDSVKELPILD